MKSKKKKKKLSKFWKMFLIVILAIAIPSFIIVAILYANDKTLLVQFNHWISQSGNLSTFIITLGLYFPFLNGVWKLLLNIHQTIIAKQQTAKLKLNKVKIYDDEHGNYIYYDKDNNLLDLQLKAAENVNLEKLTEMVSVELKEKIKSYEKNNKNQ